MKGFLTLFDYKIEIRKIKDIQLQVSCAISKGGTSKNKNGVSVRILTKHWLFKRSLATENRVLKPFTVYSTLFTKSPLL